MKIINVIVITGTPGVGKTTISKALAPRLKAFYVGLDDIVKTDNLILNVDRNRNTLVADLAKLRKKIEQVIHDASQTVIVEGHYASQVVPAKLTTHVFVLRRDPEELKAELESRSYDEKKILENMSSEIVDVCLVDAINEYGLKQIHEIDVTQRSVEDVLEEILMILNNQKQCHTGIVDWLGKLEQEGRLDKVLTLLEKI